MKKRVFTFLMTAVMLLSMIPVAAADYTPALFRIVSKNTSTLAPGVTQDIISTQRTDGKGQNMYYVTTADLSRDDVHVYANFAGNQWTNFKLEEITKQLSAAKERHSNPADEANYIEYYEPVAIFNADFYNMSTGQPNGAFAMEGHIVQAAKGTFFAVREDGTAVIGRNASEWNTLNAESPIREAVGGGTVLVWDGKIAYTGNDTSVEPRTMVGVTADGKVVLALLDGRQAPFSYGGGMNDIAEMMLSLGCDRAINLDGGGSSGYAARQEGASEVAIVNRPSDGYERAVSSSLMIVSTTPPSDAFVRASLKVDNDYLAPGASIPVSAVGLSSSSSAVDIPEGVQWRVDDTALGSVTQSGVFTAGQSTGDVKVQMVYNGKVVGETAIHVVEPDELACSLNSLVVPYGETVDFTVKALYRTDYEVTVPDGAISLALSDPALGTLNGYSFAASSDESAPGKGTLTITCGALKKEVPITLGRASVVLYDFENDALDSMPEDFKWNPNDNHAKYNIKTPHAGIVDRNTGRVRSGEHALALQADWSNICDKGGCTTIQLDYIGEEKIDLADAVGLGAWVWMPDEYKETNIRFLTKTGAGTTISSSNLGRIRESAYEEGCWVYLYQKLNDGTTGAYTSKDAGISFLQFELWASATCDPAIKSAAKPFTFYVDDITVDYSPAVPDREAPVFGAVNLSLANGNTALTRGSAAQCAEGRMSFNAVVQDDTTKDNYSGIDPDSAVVTVDGIGVSAAYHNGSLISQEVSLAAGVHTVRMAISDAAGNERSVIRQVNVTANTDVPTVRVIPHDAALNNLPLGSVYYVDVVATDVDAVQAVDLKLDLNDISGWELDYATVDSCFEMTHSVQDWHMGDNIATISFSRKDTGETDTRTGEVVLASLPIRVWSGDATWTGKSVGQWPRDVSVEVDLGRITYTAGHEPDTLPGFSAARIQADTELNAWGNAVANSKWHVHTDAALEDKTATCTEDGYTGRTYCEGCKSVVEWGELTRGGHAWYIASFDTLHPTLANVLHCHRCEILYTGEYTNPAYGNKQYYKDGVLYTGWVDDKYYVSGTQKTDEFQMIEDKLYRFVDGVCEGQTPYTGEHEDKMYADGLAANGWVNESYYDGGVKRTGMQKIDDKYYDFGENGICKGKTPYTGFLTVEKDRYYAVAGEIQTSEGWFSVGDERCHACEGKGGALGEVTEGDNRTCTQDGYKFFLCSCGEQEMSDPLWAEGHQWDEQHVCTKCGTVGRDIANAKVTFAGSQYFVYTGEAIRAKHTVTDGGRTLVVESDRRGKDGLATFKNNINVGVATLTIDGRGDYYGTLTVNFFILPADVKELRVQTQTRDSVTLAWDAAPGAAYYALYRKAADAPDTSENWTFIKSVRETELEVTGLTPGESYEFRVASRTDNPDDKNNPFAGASWTKTTVNLAHQWEISSETEATCTTDGSRTRRCVYCGETETETLPKLGHDVAEWKVTKEPTIHALGIKTGRCSRCDQDVEVEIAQLISYRIITPNAEGYSVSPAQGSASPVEEGGSYRFTVRLKGGYRRGSGFAVKVNGSAVTAGKDGAYTISNITEDQTITVEGVEKIPNTYAITLPEPTPAYSLTAADYSISPVEEGKSYSFRVTIADGYRKSSDFAVKANNKELTASADGLYTVSGITQPQNITVDGVERITHTIILESGTGYELKFVPDSASSNVEDGGSVSFAVLIEKGYCPGDGYAVMADGEKLTPGDGGIYTISNIKGDRTVTVAGVEEAPVVTETEAPKVEVQLDSPDQVSDEQKEELKQSVEKTEASNLDAILKTAEAVKELIDTAKKAITGDGTPEKPEEIKVKVSLDITAKSYTPASQSGDQQASLKLEIKPVYKVVKPKEPDSTNPDNPDNPEEPKEEVIESGDLDTTSFHEEIEIAIPLPSSFFSGVGGNQRLIVKHYKDGKEIVGDRKIVIPESSNNQVVAKFYARSFSEYEIVSDEDAIEVAYTAAGVDGYPVSAIFTSADIGTLLPVLEKSPATVTYTDVEHNDIVTATTTYTYEGWRINGEDEIYKELTQDLFDALKLAENKTLIASFAGEEDIQRTAIKEPEPEKPDPEEPKPEGPSGGGGGGGASSKPGADVPVRTETSQNGVNATVTVATPDSSVKEGVASIRVDKAIGEEIVKQAVSNKSESVVIAPKIAGKVTKAEISIPVSTVKELEQKTSASLIVSTSVADVWIPNAGLPGLSGTKGDTVSVTVEKTGSVVDLTIKSGSKTVDSVTGGVSVSIPMEKLNPGIVAVITNRDGTTETIRKSIALNNSIYVPLDGSAKVTLVDKSTPFDDVSSDSWAFDAVAFASSHELFVGTGDSQFSPDQPMTRGMLAAVLYRLERGSVEDLDISFTDVQKGQWYSDAVAWAADAGIVSGYGDGTFGADRSITREQLAVMLYRSAGSPKVTGSLNFDDAGQASSWARDALIWAQQNGIMNGYNGRVNPTDNASRAEVAQMILGCVSQLAKK